MKILRLLSLVGITSIALAHAGLAAGHDGGGGGGFGGGGFSGGRGGGFSGGAHFGGGFGGAPHFGGGVGGFHAPGPSRIVGVGTRGGGVGFGTGRYSPYMSAPSSAVRSSVAGRPAGSNSRQAVNTRPTAPNRAPNTAPVSRSSGNIAQRGPNGRTDHIAERHEASNWHHDWDRRHAHFFNHRFFVFDDGVWFGLDDGFYPWDYYPYYAFDYYPYDYYPGYYSDVEPYYNNEGVSNTNVPAPDPTVSAVQTRLTQLGYYNGPADGVYGPLTRDAVARYQTNLNLPVTGNLSNGILQSLGVPGLANN